MLIPPPPHTHIKLPSFLALPPFRLPPRRMASTSSGAGLDSHESQYYELVRSLLGSPGRVDAPHLLLTGVKYVLLALSSKNGPLEGLLVASGLLTEGPSVPVRLSLLPRSSVWANHAIEACAGDAGTPARLAEAT